MASGVAKHPYTPPTDGNKGNFLQLKQGDRIEDIKLLDGGWWYGSASSAQEGGKGKKKVCGYFPSTYVTLDERNPSGKQASYDGGALRRSTSKTLARMQSGGGGGDSAPMSGGGGGGSMARRSSINKLRMMAYGTTSDVVECTRIANSSSSSSNHSPSRSRDKSKSPRRQSATTPLEFVDERVLRGGVLALDLAEGGADDDDKGQESQSQSQQAPASTNSTVFKLKDDATNSYFTFKDGVYAWMKDE
jgi:hypothetical protein